jgi:hypothetical protein
MWILHSLAHGLLPVPVASTALLRLGFGAAFLWKFGWDARWGGLHYFDKGAFVRWRYERLKRHAKLLLSPLAYKWFYVSRLVAAVLVMAGIEASAAAALVALWCAFEFTFDRKFHTQFLLVCAACLAVSSHLDDCLSVWTVSDSASCRTDTTSPVPLILLAVVVVCMYWGSVRFKLQSPQFMRGDVLQKTAEHYALIAGEMPYREYRYPRAVMRFLALDPPDIVRRRWQPSAVATVCLEAVLPILLVVTATTAVAVGLGIAMHLAFMALFPKRLLPFSLAAVVSYLAFIDPQVVMGWI